MVRRGGGPEDDAADSRPPREPFEPRRPPDTCCRRPAAPAPAPAGGGSPAARELPLHDPPLAPAFSAPPEALDAAGPVAQEPAGPLAQVGTLLSWLFAACAVAACCRALLYGAAAASLGCYGA